MIILPLIFGQNEKDGNVLQLIIKDFQTMKKL